MKSTCTVQYKLTDLKKQKTFRPVSNKSAACILLTHCIMYIKLKIVLCIWYYVVPSSRNCLFFFFLIWFYYYFTSHNTKFLLIAHK